MAPKKVPQYYSKNELQKLLYDFEKLDSKRKEFYFKTLKTIIEKGESGKFGSVLSEEGNFQDVDDDSYMLPENELEIVRKENQALAKIRVTNQWMLKSPTLSPKSNGCVVNGLEHCKMEAEDKKDAVEVDESSTERKGEEEAKKNMSDEERKKMEHLNQIADVSQKISVLTANLQNPDIVKPEALKVSLEAVTKLAAQLMSATDVAKESHYTRNCKEQSKILHEEDNENPLTQRKSNTALNSQEVTRCENMISVEKRLKSVNKHGTSGGNTNTPDGNTNTSDGNTNTSDIEKAVMRAMGSFFSKYLQDSNKPEKSDASCNTTVIESLHINKSKFLQDSNKPEKRDASCNTTVIESLHINKSKYLQDNNKSERRDAGCSTTVNEDLHGNNKRMQELETSLVKYTHNSDLRKSYHSKKRKMANVLSSEANSESSADEPDVCDCNSRNGTNDSNCIYISKPKIKSKQICLCEREKQIQFKNKKPCSNHVSKTNASSHAGLASVKIKAPSSKMEFESVEPTCNITACCWKKRAHDYNTECSELKRKKVSTSKHSVQFEQRDRYNSVTQSVKQPTYIYHEDQPGNMKRTKEILIRKENSECFYSSETEFGSVGDILPKAKNDTLFPLGPFDRLLEEEDISIKMQRNELLKKNDAKSCLNKQKYIGQREIRNTPDKTLFSKMTSYATSKNQGHLHQQQVIESKKIVNKTKNCSGSCSSKHDKGNCKSSGKRNKKSDFSDDDIILQHRNHKTSGRLNFNRIPHSAVIETEDSDDSDEDDISKHRNRKTSGGLNFISTPHSAVARNLENSDFDEAILKHTNHKTSSGLSFNRIPHSAVVKTVDNDDSNEDVILKHRNRKTSSGVKHSTVVKTVENDDSENYVILKHINRKTSGGLTFKGKSHSTVVETDENDDSEEDVLKHRNHKTSSGVKHSTVVKTVENDDSENDVILKHTNRKTSGGLTFKGKSHSTVVKTDENDDSEEDVLKHRNHKTSSGVKHSTVVKTVENDDSENDVILKHRNRKTSGGLTFKGKSHSTVVEIVENDDSEEDVLKHRNRKTSSGVKHSTVVKTVENDDSENDVLLKHRNRKTSSGVKHSTVVKTVENDDSENDVILKHINRKTSGGLTFKGKSHSKVVETVENDDSEEDVLKHINRKTSSGVKHSTVVKTVENDDSENAVILKHINRKTSGGLTFKGKSLSTVVETVENDDSEEDVLKHRNHKASGGLSFNRKLISEFIETEDSDDSNEDIISKHRNRKASGGLNFNRIPHSTVVKTVKNHDSEKDVISKPRNRNSLAGLNFNRISQFVETVENDDMEEDVILKPGNRKTSSGVKHSTVVKTVETDDLEKNISKHRITRNSRGLKY